MTISYELKLDKTGRKLAFKVVEGKKTRINYKIAQNRQRGVRYRAKKIEDQKILEPLGLDVMETRQRVREQAKTEHKTPKYESQPRQEVERSILQGIIDKAKRTIGGVKPEDKPVIQTGIEDKGLDFSDAEEQASELAKAAMKNPELIIESKRGKTEAEIKEWALGRILSETQSYIKVRWFLLSYENGIDETPTMYKKNRIISPPSRSHFNSERDEVINLISTLLDEGFYIDTSESGVCIRWIKQRLTGFTKNRRKEHIDVINPYSRYLGCYSKR